MILYLFNSLGILKALDILWQTSLTWMSTAGQVAAADTQYEECLCLCHQLHLIFETQTCAWHFPDFFFFFIFGLFYNSLALALNGEFMEIELRDTLTIVFRNTLLFRLWTMLLMIFSSWNKLLMVENLGAFCK